MQSSTRPVERPTPSIVPYLIGSALAAAWISLGSIHRDQHSDSILNVLISLQRWTYFVWEQDRFGMLVPLLALPIRHPLANLIFQAFLATFAGLSTFFLLARWAFRDPSYPLVGAIGAVSLLVLTPDYYRFEYLVDTSYGIGLSLALWALILVEPGRTEAPRRRLLFVMILMGLSHWVNNAVALFLVPFVVLRGAGPAILRIDWTAQTVSMFRRLERLRSQLNLTAFGRVAGIRVEDLGRQVASLISRLWRVETIRATALLAIGYLIGRILIWISPDQPTSFESLPWEDWPAGWVGLIKSNRQALDPPLWIAAMVIEAIIGIVATVRSSQAREVGWIAFSLVATAVFLWLSLGTRVWVYINAYAFRYLFTSLLLIQTATLGLAIAPIRRKFGASRRSRLTLATLIAMALVGSAARSYGRPSVAGVRRDIDRVCGGLTEDLLDSHCTFLAGNYWNVWISVFHVNLVRYERGDQTMFWGLASRSAPTRELWTDTPVMGWTAGVAHGDGRGNIWLRSLAVRKFEVVEIRPTIRVYRPVTPLRRVH